MCQCVVCECWWCNYCGACYTGISMMYCCIGYGVVDRINWNQHIVKAVIVFSGWDWVEHAAVVDK